MGKVEMVEINGPSVKAAESKQEKAPPTIVRVNKKISPAGKKLEKEEIAPFFGRVRNLHVACMLNVETTNLFPQSFDKSMQNFNVNGLEQLGTGGDIYEDDLVPSKGFFQILF